MVELNSEKERNIIVGRLKEIDKERRDSWEHQRELDMEERSLKRKLKSTKHLVKTATNYINKYYTCPMCGSDKKYYYLKPLQEHIHTMHTEGEIIDFIDSQDDRCF